MYVGTLYDSTGEAYPIRSISVHYDTLVEQTLSGREVRVRTGRDSAEVELDLPMVPGTNSPRFLLDSDEVKIRTPDYELMGHPADVSIRQEYGVQVTASLTLIGLKVSDSSKEVTKPPNPYHTPAPVRTEHLPEADLDLTLDLPDG